MYCRRPCHGTGCSQPSRLASAWPHCQESVEFRRERADLLRFFEGVDRLAPVVEGAIGQEAILGTQLHRRGVGAEYRRPSRRRADLLGVGWELDIERAPAPHLLAER